MASIEELQAKWAEENAGATLERQARQLADAAALLTGRLFTVGSGRLTLSVAGNVRAVVTNPAGSGRKILLERLTGLATAVAWADVRRNPTTGLPAGTRAPLNAQLKAAPAASVAQVAVDISATTALGGGEATSLVLGIPANREFTRRVGLELDEGQSIGFGIPFTGSADLTFNLQFKERPV